MTQEMPSGLSDLVRLLIVGGVGIVLGLVTMFALVSSQSGAETVKQPGVVYGVTTPVVR